MANHLLRECPKIAQFLGDHGLRVRLPLHIVLDDVLDQPRVRVAIIPHREVRIPLRAPGVLEDGANLPDPWHYFLFMGLSAQCIYGERSGIPEQFHKVFGDLVSPNVILPDWGIDGIGYLLYTLYTGHRVPSPMADTYFDATPVPSLDRVSNHPDDWPGRFSHRIYGRPFLQWLHDQYGWEKIYQILHLHGKDLIPLEIDREALSVFGKSWSQIWRDFQQTHAGAVPHRKGLPIVGYWDTPFVYWNEAGIHPGVQSYRLRGRYGWLDDDGWLRLGEYDAKGASHLKFYKNQTVLTSPEGHIWDPGPGNVAVTRVGRRPFIVLNFALPATYSRSLSHPINATSRPKERHLIEAPPGVLQLSGPIADEMGRIAVSANSGGNWDIWLYDGVWQRLTMGPSIEMDPWFRNGRLIFSSNASGRFQIHARDLTQLTHASTAAILPRDISYLELRHSGWYVQSYSAVESTKKTATLPDSSDLSIEEALTPEEEAPVEEEQADEPGHPYSITKSILPNYIMPDLFIDTDDFQFGISTRARDVTGDYGWDAGVRYSPKTDIWSWRLGGEAKNWNARTTRYPFGYTTARLRSVSEIRHEAKLGWEVFFMPDLEISANYRYYESEYDDEISEDEWWGSFTYKTRFHDLHIKATADLFAEGSQSLYGELSYGIGQRTNTIIYMRYGRTWGDPLIGHNTFRIGGNVGEGFFTQRPTRLFPLRGFDANILDSTQAGTAGIETFWPLLRLQRGYKTLPLFLRNINIGTFVDSGFAADRLSSDDLLVSAGFEFITGMELAWGFMADFRLGLAWPLVQPDDLDQEGPVFLIQIGRPL